MIALPESISKNGDFPQPLCEFVQLNIADDFHDDHDVHQFGFNFVRGEGLRKVDFIKMDIKGAETAALRRAVGTVRRGPKVSISVSPPIEDFFKIPEIISSISCGCSFYLRHYSIHSEKTIFNCVPSPEVCPR